MKTTNKNERQQPKEQNRATLYEFFEEGQRPTGNDFRDLIYSTINKLDDGISKSFKDGLKLAPQGKEGGRVISLYERLDGREPQWTLTLKGKDLLISSKNKPLLTLTSEGKVGVMQDSPKFTLDTGGTIGLHTRIGRYVNPKKATDGFELKSNSVSADGKWHPILEGLSGSNMFEIVALAKSKSSQKNHSFLYAVVSNSTDGKGRNHKIKRNHFQWWKWWKRIGLRWESQGKGTYSLNLRTFSSYGKESLIYFHITRLWDDFDLLLDQKEEKSRKESEKQPI